MEKTRDRSLDVAVTGMSARFPGCATLEQWWAAVVGGQVLTRRYERRELLAAGVPRHLVDDPDYVPVRGHLAEAEHFDNTLFRVSPREAELMDPQHRLMLEAAWSAMEDAGSRPAGPAPVTSVFASMTGSAYLRGMLARGPLSPGTLDDVIHGTEPDFVASRIAYKLGLTGPAMAVQTACSSSLVGVHLAVQALLNGDCDQALVVAAGMTFPQAGHLYLPGGVLSRSGDCRPFDARADGVVGGSGVACVVLRRLEDALRDGPEPYGVLIGSAINNDGSAKAGYYAPSVVGQEAVIRAALTASEVDAGDVGYLEAHGTGTPLGDPIEWAAASAALGRPDATSGRVALGALKANLGPLDAASGLAALIKTLFVVRTGVVPPVAGFGRLNPLLEDEDTRLYVPTRSEPWSGPEPRRAGVSSFGIGGTNAHVVVEQPPSPAEPVGDGDTRHVLLLSAADAATLTRNAQRMRDHLAVAAPDLRDVSFTLATARAALPERLAVTGQDRAEVVDRLRTWTRVVTGRQPRRGPAPVIYLFPGQGTQYPGMAVPYTESLPGFAESLADCLERFAPKLRDRLRLALHDSGFPAPELEDTRLAQPALFAVGYAAAAALSALGVRPAAVVGHSLGEVTAASVAGVLDLADAAALVTARGRAMAECPTGAMLALGCDETRARQLLRESGADLVVAAVNAPSNCVVAGPVSAVEAFEAHLDGQVFARRLRTSHAFHSGSMSAAVPVLAEHLAAAALRPPRVPFAANLTGQLVLAGEPVTVDLFAEQIHRTVRFGAAMARLAGYLPHALVVEMGPGRALSALSEEAGLDTVALCPARGARAEEELLLALGELWARGQSVPADALCRGGRLLHLPTYSFAGPPRVAPELAGPVTAQSTAPAEPAAANGSRNVSGGPPPDVPAVLANAWAELLGHDTLDADADFFDLGGDSLLITRLARRLNDELAIRVPVRAMLAGRTLGRHTSIVLDLVRARDAQPS